MGASSSFAGRTDARYWNQIGPHGGWLAAQVLRHIIQSEEAALLPRSLQVDFIDRVEPGEFEIEVHVLRRQRTITFVRGMLLQQGRACVQANAVLAVSRTPREAQFARPVSLGAALDHPRFEALEPLAAFPAMFEYRLATGWPGREGQDASSAGFIRPRTERLITAETLTRLADAWFPALWAAGEQVPATTVSMALVFGGVEEPVELSGDEFLQASFRTSAVAGGFGDETGALWWPDGRLAVTAQQLLRFGVPRGAAADQ